MSEEEIERLVEVYESELEEMDDDELFGPDLEKMREEQITGMVEQYEAELEQHDNEELFGDGAWADLCQARIAERLEFYEDSLRGGVQS